MTLDDVLDCWRGTIGAEPKFSGGSYLGRCPAHDDRRASMSLTQMDEGLRVKCFAGCPTDAICKALGIEVKDLFPEKPKHERRASQTPAPSAPLTIADLADDKALPVATLEGFGLRQVPGGVIVPYYLADGSDHTRARLRTARKAVDGSRWTEGEGKPIPYGLHAIKGETLLLVEGESDCWTAWFHGVPALGIPGASMAGTLQAEHLAGVTRLYLLQEPDKGGAEFRKGVAARLKEIGWQGEAKAFRLAVKDLNDLHKADPENFKAKLKAAMHDAEHIDGPRPRTQKEDAKHVRARIKQQFAEEKAGTRRAIEIPYGQTAYYSGVGHPGASTILFGTPGHGKTLWLLNCLLKMQEQKERWEFLTMEDGKIKLGRRLLCLLSGEWTPLQIAPENADRREEIERVFGDVFEAILEHCYEPPSLEFTDSDWVIEWLRGAVTRSRFVAIDNLSKINYTGREEWRKQKEFVNTAVAIASKSDCSLLMVAHPVKAPTGKGGMTGSDLGGCRALREVIHNLLILDRHQFELKESEIEISTGVTAIEQHDITLVVDKARDTKGNCKIAYRSLDGGKFQELGPIKRKGAKRKKEEAPVMPYKDDEL
jgi:hypothetical protein